MKKLVTTIAAILVASSVYALGDKCTTSAVVVGGVVKTCTTCCNSFGTCQTYCS